MSPLESPCHLLDFTESRLAHALATVQTGGYQTALPELNAYEKALIYHYTYQGSAAIKDPVRAHDGALLEPLGQCLAAALRKLPPYAGLVYSAEFWTEDELLDLQRRAATGPNPFHLNEKRWPTFLSASQSSRVAHDHLFHYGGRKNCRLLLVSRTGRYIDALSHYGANGRDPAASEREVLFLPNTRFRVVQVRRATTYWEIELLEI